MSQLPRVRFLIAWGVHSKGAEYQPRNQFELNSLVKGIWYGRRIAELACLPSPALPIPAKEIDPIAAAFAADPEPFVISSDHQQVLNPLPQPTRRARGRNKGV